MTVAFPIPVTYDALNWYFALSGSTTQVWSTQQLLYVPVADAGYLAWLAAGFSPTILNSGTPSVDQTNLNDAMQQEVLSGILSIGVNFTASFFTPSATFSLGADGMALLKQNAASLGIAHLPTSSIPVNPSPAPPSTFSVPDISGNMWSFTAAQFTAFYNSVIDFADNYSQLIWGNILGGGVAPPVSPIVAVAGYLPGIITAPATYVLGAGSASIACNPATGPIVFTAPAAPTDGQTLTIADVGGSASATNFISFSGNIDGFAPPAKITFPYGWWTLQYVQSLGLWKQI